MNEQRKDFKKDTVSEKPVLLRMENIEKAFPGVKALDKVNLTVKAGTVHALMGENGAGKSTLMKCLFGVYNKDSGNIYLDGKEIISSKSSDGTKTSTKKSLSESALPWPSGTIWREKRVISSWRSSL